ncbi:MAG: translation initiation factor IF-2 [Clostridiales bacterium]|nr:translation initiation factor IF-2 [Clostridiales bacterium]
MDVKYRVHEVAKDFKVKGKPVGSKKVTEILTKYGSTPSSHMAALSEMELSLIFEYLTQHNQVADLQAALAVPAKQPAAPAKKPVQQPAQKGQQSPTQKPQQAPAQKQQERSGNAKLQEAAKPAAQAPAQKQQASQNKPSSQQQSSAAPVSRVPQKKVVNTRKSADVNLDRYDARLDELAPDRADKMAQGKQKLKSNRSQQKRKGAQGQKRRQEEQRQQMRRLQQEIARKAPTKVQIPDEISVGELASRMKKTGASVVKELMKMGVMASLSEVIDFDTAALVAEEMGCKVEHEVVVTIEEKLIDTAEDKEEDLVPRPPVIVVMGHVDHGKTSLLDYIRSTNVTAGEAGGITQAIGAYQVEVSGGRTVTFLDTPGHEAFTAMRARGAMVTDIAILVVAADDGIMPQTIEAINHAKAANIPIVVAINKMDLPNANPEAIKQQLTQYGLLSEEWGGDTIICPISAKTGEGIDDLLENVLLVAEMRELKANPNRAARGAVVEARLDKGRGPVATLLVQNGTLKQGDIIIAGTAVGRIRAMTDYRGRPVKKAGPSVPVEITGMAEVPGAGDDFYAVADERMARELAEQRKQEKKDALAAPAAKKVSLDDLFDQIQVGEVKELKIIVKADVQGSAEAVCQNLMKLSNDEVRVNVIHSGVGAINESDVMLASTSNAIIVGFSVRPDNVARTMIERDKVDVRLYRVIYDCIEEIEAAMKGMLAPKYHEVELGRVEVREVYKITGAGIIAGCYVKEGKVVRNAQIRLVRDGIVIHEGAIASLRRFKDDVKEVATSFECGIGLEKFSDIKVGDIFEVYQVEEVAQ